MRIGVFTDCLSRRYTGVEIITHELVKSLCETSQVTCYHAPSKMHPKFEGARHVLIEKKLPLPFYRTVAQLFRKYDVDVLHAPSPQFPFVKKPNAPVVVTVHDLIPIFMPKFHNIRRALFFKKILPWYLRRVDAVIAVSEATKRDVMRFYRIPEEKISVVHNGLPPVRYVKRKKEPYILYVGTLEPRKNIVGVVRAFSFLKSKGFDKKLLIVGGKGWKYKGIFELVSRLGLRDDVVFTGYVSNERKAELYQKAEALVYPSFYEGFGLPVLEAMSHGTPVVTSNVSSLPEVAGGAAVLVNPHSVESIADGIVEAIENSSSLISKGLKQSKKFSVDKMVDGVLEVYESVI